jgi:hypothetical protein
MKNLISTRSILWIGILCVTLGFVLPFLTVLGVIKSTFGLAFLTFLMQLIGIILGTIYTAGKFVEGRNKYKKRQKGEELDDQQSKTGWME